MYLHVVHLIRQDLVYLTTVEFVELLADQLKGVLAVGKLLADDEVDLFHHAGHVLDRFKFAVLRLLQLLDSMFVQDYILELKIFYV